MSKMLGRVTVACTVHSPEHLPTKRGEQMYADDVVEELRDVVAVAVAAWCEQRGRELLATDPDVS